MDTITELIDQNSARMETLIQEGENTLAQIGHLDQTVTSLLEDVIAREERTLESFSIFGQKIAATEQAIEAIIEEARNDLSQIQEKAGSLEQQLDEFSHELQSQLAELRESMQEFLDELEDKTSAVEEGLSTIAEQSSEFAEEVDALENTAIQEIEALYTLVENAGNDLGEGVNELATDVGELASAINEGMSANRQSLNTFMEDSAENLEEVSQEEIQPAFEEFMNLIWVKLVVEPLSSAAVATNQAKSGILMVGEKGLEIKESIDEDFEGVLRAVKEGVLDDLSDAQEDLKDVETIV